MFGSVDGFPVVVLPLFMSMALSLVSSLYNVQTFCKDVDSFLIFIFVFLSVSGIFRIRSRLCLLPDTELFWLFRYVRTDQFWPSLPTCALIPRWAHWIRLFVSSLRWWTSRDIHLSVYQPNFASRLSAHRLCRCRLVILHELEDRLATNFLLFAALIRRGASDCVLPTISRASFWTVLWTYFGLCPASSVLCDDSFNTVRWHRAVCDDYIRFRLPKCYAFSCTLPKWIQEAAFWECCDPVL